MCFHVVEFTAFGSLLVIGICRKNGRLSGGMDNCPTEKNAWESCKIICWLFALFNSKLNTVVKQ